MKQMEELFSQFHESKQKLNETKTNIFPQTNNDCVFKKYDKFNIYINFL